MHVQVILYGRGQSDIIPKLRGTFEPIQQAATASEATDLQKSIFNAPPSGIPQKPTENGVKGAEPHGVKRPRDEEEEDEQSDAPMEEDEDDAPMQEDSD
jgi:U2 small nuclear ribonucleoprotein B''